MTLKFGPFRYDDFTDGMTPVDAATRANNVLQERLFNPRVCDHKWLDIRFGAGGEPYCSSCGSHLLPKTINCGAV